MTRMKSLSRMYVWWPGLDKDIEVTVSSCHECQMQQQHWLLYSHGAGLHVPGPEYIWTS